MEVRMNRMIGLIFVLLFGGCYTQLQLASRESPSHSEYVSPDPIVVYVPIPCPHPGPPPIPPSNPVYIQTTQPDYTSLAAPTNTTRRNGQTRDINPRENGEGNSGRGGR